MSIRIIACGVFRDALRQIGPQHFPQNVFITYITPVLHNYPEKLKEEMLRQIHLATKAGDEILCLYGRCYPDLDDHLYEMGIPRVSGAHCYEILLGSRRFNNILEEEAGTYFVEKELILNFSEYCIQPLELDDPLMRESFFQHYKRLAYIQQSLDSDSIITSFHDISQFLNLIPMLIDADYSELTKNLLRLFANWH
ncbi:MAG: DUF1638 domain-containing protein [Desulfobacterales bacterium]|uniref:DUF1638 domain-containing protein n=1 Tax=Candidatus Desulfatibia vada TaxID=2841696 RepID=A0A8J6P1C2_9BACT|nr:DUF1638 domain-containing protein [Candidatus Desulfatibia vada]MBL6972685.1 DUF1638 domain-containing protein [Desulfobacterales bacterium]